MVGRDQYGYIKGPYYMVKPGPKHPGEHNKVESKKLNKLGRFPKLRAAERVAGAAGKAFSLLPQWPMKRFVRGEACVNCDSQFCHIYPPYLPRPIFLV